jgi:hypothetical protein
MALNSPFPCGGGSSVTIARIMRETLEEIPQYPEAKGDPAKIKVV